MTTTFNDLANVVANRFGRWMQIAGITDFDKWASIMCTDLEWETADIIRENTVIFKADWNAHTVTKDDGETIAYAEFEKMWRAELDRINAFLPTAKQTETGLETLANEFCEMMFFRVPTEDGIGQPCIRYTEKFIDDDTIVTYMFPTAQNGCDIEYDALYAGFERIA